MVVLDMILFYDLIDFQTLEGFTTLDSCFYIAIKLHMAQHWSAMYDYVNRTIKCRLCVTKTNAKHSSFLFLFLIIPVLNTGHVV